MSTHFEKHYKAFISYSHADNRVQGRKWADWLHHSLETYQIPTELVGQLNQYGQEIPAQIYPVFQDEKELSANASLSASLQQALDHAQFLIYLSSPTSANSFYVQEEIKYYKKSGRSSQIIALILRGEPEYGDRHTQQQCFPDVLRYAVDKAGNICYEQPEEALAADVRLPNSAEEGFTSMEAYRRHLQGQKLSAAQIKVRIEVYQERLNLAKLKIIATILGVPLGELTKRDQVYQLERIKRKNRNIIRVVTVVSTLAIAASAAGIYAWQQKNKAQENLAQSLYVSGINKLAQNEYGDPAAYIAAAVRHHNANAIEFAASMLAIKDDMVLLPNMFADTVSFSPDGRYLAGFANQGDNVAILQVWDTHTQRQRYEIGQSHHAKIARPLFDQHNALYVQLNPQELIRYQVATQKTEVVYRGAGDDRLLAVSANGQWLALRQAKQQIVTLVNTMDNRIQLTMPMSVMDNGKVFFSSDGSHAVVSREATSDGAETRFELVRLHNDAIAEPRRISVTLQFDDGQFSKDGRYFLARGYKDLVLIDVTSGLHVRLSAEHGRYTWSAFNPDGLTLIAGDTQGYDVYHVQSGTLKKHYDLPVLSKLTKALSQQEAELDKLSPDQTQGIRRFNKLTYLQNLASNNVLIKVQRLTTPKRQVEANKEGTHLYALNKAGNLFERINIENGHSQPAFIRLSEPATYFRMLEHQQMMVVSKNKTVQFYATDTGAVMGPAISIPHARGIRISRDGRRMLTRTDDYRFSVWQIHDGQELIRYQAPTGEKLANFTSDDDLTMVIIAEQNAWRVLDIQRQQILFSGHDNLTKAVFSASGRWLALGTDQGRADVYDIRTQQKRFSFKTIANPLLHFSPDGETLLATQESRRLRLWRTQEGQAYGQIIPINENSLLFHFSSDGRRLFVQDAVEKQLNPSIKIIDISTGNLLSLPFANGLYERIQVSADEQRIITIEKDGEAYVAKLWLVPMGQNSVPEQLAMDLENFYGRKYDPQTGAINEYDGDKKFNTWFFQDIYTRLIGPNAKMTVLEAIEQHLPVQNDDNLWQLSSMYFYHPLARAGLAEYFARQSDSAALAERLIELTELQLLGIHNTHLRQAVEPVLQRAQTHLATYRTRHN